MTDPCLICGEPTDQLGQCDRHSTAGIVRRLQNFNPQPIEPGYLGDEIATLMDDAASLILAQAAALGSMRAEQNFHPALGLITKDWQPPTTTVHARHAFTPDPKCPWFCATCGYGPRELLQHLPIEKSS